MMDINQDIVFACPQGDETLHVDVSQTLNIEINVAERQTSALMLFVTGQGELNITVNLDTAASLNYLWINESLKELKVDETFNLGKDTSLQANYGELSGGELVKTTLYCLQGTGAQVETRSATLASRKVNWQMSAEHQALHTAANLNNYGIGIGSGDLTMTVIGHIAKGMSYSSTHQTTRFLNLSTASKATAFPELLIDENNVEASHACTIGQADEEILYYLQARGLPRMEATRLIITGYLLPITESIQQEDLRDQLQQSIEEKVSVQCLA